MTTALVFSWWGWRFEGNDIFLGAGEDMQAVAESSGGAED